MTEMKLKNDHFWHFWSQNHDINHVFCFFHVFFKNRLYSVIFWSKKVWKSVKKCHFLMILVKIVNFNKGFGSQKCHILGPHFQKVSLLGPKSVFFKKVIFLASKSSLFFVFFDVFLSLFEKNVFFCVFWKKHVFFQFWFCHYKSRFFMFFSHF